MLRPGYVQRSWRVLDILHTYQPSAVEIRKSLSRVEGIELNHLLPLLTQCGYVTSTANPELTSSGLIAWQLGGGEAFLRQQISDYMRITGPNWVGLARQGRGSFLSYASGELLQCFSEAGLLRNDTSAAEWWDALYLAKQADLSAENLLIGRLGESKSLLFEKNRLGFEPEWVSLHRPNSPYDLLSFTSSDRSQRLVIEVKSSRESLTTAVLFLSAAEWNFISSSREAVLHLWPEVESDSDEPFIVPAYALSGHIPVNRGSGQWQSAIVPYAALLVDSSNSATPE